MKNKFFFTSMVIILFSQYIMAQENKVANALKELNNDTAKYIELRIMNKKNCYEGQLLDSLLKDLPKVISYANGDSQRNRFISPSSVLYFTTEKITIDKLNQKQFPMILIITWATPLDNNELSSLGLNVGGGKWTETASNFYKNKTIGKIETVVYNSH